MESMFHMFYMQGTAGVHPAFEEDTFGCSSCRCIPVSNLCDYVGRVLSFLHKLSWELRRSTELTSLLNFVVEKQLYPEYSSQQIDFTPTKYLLMVPFQKIWEEENVEPQVSPPRGLTSLLH